MCYCAACAIGSSHVLQIQIAHSAGGKDHSEPRDHGVRHLSVLSRSSDVDRTHGAPIRPTQRRLVQIIRPFPIMKKKAQVFDMECR